MKVRKVLENAIPEVTSALLSDFGVDLHETETSVAQRAAIIGFSGEVLRGSMGLVLTPALLEHAHQSMMGSAPDERQLNDLLGELSNQLLGRIKTVLLRYQVEIYLSTPMVLRGINLSVCGSQSGLLHAHFSSNYGPVGVWLDVQHEPGLEVELQPQEEAAIEEGDLLFF